MLPAAGLSWPPNTSVLPPGEGHRCLYTSLCHCHHHRHLLRTLVGVYADRFCVCCVAGCGGCGLVRWYCAVCLRRCFKCRNGFLCVVLEAVRVVHVIICKCAVQRGVALPHLFLSADVPSCQFLIFLMLRRMGKSIGFKPHRTNPGICSSSARMVFLSQPFFSIPNLFHHVLHTTCHLSCFVFFLFFSSFFALFYFSFVFSFFYGLASFVVFSYPVR